jgi:hypothetical protein
MSAAALLIAVLVFKRLDTTSEGKTIGEVMRSLWRILRTPRLMALTLIVAGFWIIQGQLYASMPKYVIRLLGEQARPEWLANVNPAVVVLFVVLVTQVMRRFKSVTSMAAGMMLMPFSALAMAWSQALERFTGDAISILGLFSLHPVTVMMIVGIAIQGLAECFISPRFLEYFSLQAPAGEEGSYLGFSHLHTFFSAIAGFIMSGYLLDTYCPDPKTLPAGLTAAQRASHYADAHLLWYYFAVVGVVAAVALLAFRSVTGWIDARAGEARPEA